MKIKRVKRCEACQQPFEADLRAAGRQTYCSTPRCQQERRMRSRRYRRAAKSSLNQPSDDMLIGGNKSSKLHSASRLIEAEWITEDPFIVGLMSMLCDTENPDELQAMIMRLKKRGQEIAQRKKSEGSSE